MQSFAVAAAVLASSIVSLVGGHQAATLTNQLDVIDHVFSVGDVDITTKRIVEKEETPGEVLGTETEPVPAPEPEAPQPVIVTVISGDSLSKIARAHTVTVQRLFDANPGIANPDIIHVGMQIKIPLENEVLETRPMPVAPKPVAKKPVTSSSPKRIASTAPAVADGSVWDALARCESGGNWHINTGNGYSGGLQFLPSTWRAVGGTGLPHENSREEQILRGQILQARSGWGQWPACARKLGLL